MPEGQEAPTSVIQKDAPASREKMSDEELGNLLAAFGNHEAKALTLISMMPERIYTSTDLYSTLIKSQGDDIGWKPNSMTPFGYCLKSLSPIGLVTKEYLDQEQGIYGYEITSYGRDVGVPLAGLLLDFSLRHGEISLIRLFGSTKSSSSQKNSELSDTAKAASYKERSPLSRFKILGEIATRDLPLRMVDIEGDMRISQSKISNHLREMKRLGLINVESTEVNKSFIDYKLSEEGPKQAPHTHRNDSYLTQAVWGICQKYPELDLTRNDIVAKLVETNPRYAGKKPKDRTLLNRTSGILAHLARAGYLQKGKFSKTFHSEISISDDQRKIIEELLTILYEFQNQNPEIVEKGKRLAEELIVNSDKVRDLMEKVKLTSPYVSQFPFEEMQTMVLSIIQENPNITNKEIRAKLEEQGRKKRASRIEDATRALVKAKKVRVYRDGNHLRFSELTVVDENDEKKSQETL